MEICSNCNSSYTPGADGSFVVSAGKNTVASICADCAAGAKTLKIVLQRSKDGALSYEQFTPVEMYR